MAAQCQQMAQALSPGLDEYTYSGAFWALGILVIANGIWVDEQYDRYMDLYRQAKFDSIQSPVAAELLARRRSGRFFWLQPHITTPLRQFLAVAICGLVLPLLLLELSWVYKAMWRLSVAAFHSTCACDDRFNGQILPQYSLCILVLAVVLAAWAFLSRRSLSMVFGQLSYVLQLRSLRSEAPLDLRGIPQKPGTTSGTDGSRD